MLSFTVFNKTCRKWLKFVPWSYSYIHSNIVVYFYLQSTVLMVTFDQKLVTQVQYFFNLLLVNYSEQMLG